MEPIDELREHAEKAHDPFDRKVGASMAIIAALLALVAVYGHISTTDELLSQQKASDQWAFYQAKSLRRYQSEVAHDLLGAIGNPAAAELEKKYTAGIESLRKGRRRDPEPGARIRKRKRAERASRPPPASRRNLPRDGVGAGIPGHPDQAHSNLARGPGKLQLRRDRRSYRPPHPRLMWRRHSCLPRRHSCDERRDCHTLRCRRIVRIAGIQPRVGHVQLHLNPPQPFARHLRRTIADEVLMMQRERDPLRHGGNRIGRIDLKVDAARSMRQVVEKRQPLVVLLQLDRLARSGQVACADSENLGLRLDGAGEQFRAGCAGCGCLLHRKPPP